MSTATIELPPKLIPVFEGEARYRCAYGGRGSGKTRGFAKMSAVVGYVKGMNGQEGQILCAREFMNSLDESSLEEVKAAIRSEPFLNEYYEIGEKYVRSKDGRIRYTFAGLRHNLDSIKSKARILLCWVDEAEPVSDEAWRKLIPTVREEGSEIWVTWNPESSHSPTHKRFRASKPTASKVAEINWRDNPWFPKVLEQERKDDLRDRPEHYAHVWEGDFATYIEGAYYAALIADAKAEGRITSVPVNPNLPIHTSWDLGIGDSMAIWVFQAGPEGMRVLDYIEDHGKPIPHYVAELETRGYRGGRDYVPHDAKVRSLDTGRSRLETLDSLGRHPVLLPASSVDDGINGVRQLLPRMWFDAEKCAHGLEALRHYRTEYDEKARVFKPRPLHDWSSHCADAMRYGAQGYRDLAVQKIKTLPKLKPGQIMLEGPPKPPSGTRIEI